MDSTRIACINHHFDPFKLDFLALLQQALGLFNHEASQGVAFALGHLPALFVQFQDAVRIEEWCFGFHEHRVGVQKTVVDLLVVKLVRDFTHDFFQHVFQGDDATRAAVFVDNDRQMHLAFLKFPEKVVDFLALGHEHGGANALVPQQVVFVKLGNEVLDVKDTDDLVGGSFVNRNSTEAGGDNGRTYVGPCIGHRKRQHVGPRRHDLLGVFRPKVHDAFEDALFFLRSLGVVGEFQGSLQIFHTQRCCRCPQTTVQPSPHANQGPPSRLKQPLCGEQGRGHEFGQMHPVRSGVDLGNDFAKQHQDEGDAHHMNGGV